MTALETDRLLPGVVAPMEDDHDEAEDEGYDPRLDGDDEMEHGNYWEDNAYRAVSHFLDQAAIDDVRGVITLPPIDEAAKYAGDEECSSYDQMFDHLSELYEHEWYAHVPFDGGAIEDADAAGVVGDILADRGLEDFFFRLKPSDGDAESEEIVLSKDLVKTAEQSRLIRVDLDIINTELIEYLAKHPEMMREMNPRKFEELLASIYKNLGYTTTLTPASKDGGFDIFAAQRDDVGQTLSIIEAKRYSEDNKVGVEIVRGLYGVVEANRATRGIVATTSFFTKGAVEFRDTVRHRMALADFDAVTRMLRNMSKG